MNSCSWKNSAIANCFWTNRGCITVKINEYGPGSLLALVLRRSKFYHPSNGINISPSQTFHDIHILKQFGEEKEAVEQNIDVSKEEPTDEASGDSDESTKDSNSSCVIA